MLPLRGKYIFPNTVIHFDVSRSRSVKAIEESMEHDQLIFLNNQIDPTAEDPGIEDLYRVGTLARIKQVVKLPKNILRVFAEGLFRAELSETVEYEPFYKVEVLYDDRDVRPGQKFNDANLLGIPYCLTVSNRTLSDDLYELTERKNGQKSLLTHEQLLAKIG